MLEAVQEMMGTTDFASLHPVLVSRGSAGNAHSVDDAPTDRERVGGSRSAGTMKPFAALLPLILGFAAIGGPVHAQTLPTLRVAGPPLDAYKAAYYAQKAGLFRKYGVNVELSTVSSGSAAMAAISGGSIDMAFTAILPAIQAHVKGIEFKIVAPAGWYDSAMPQLLMLVRKDSTAQNGRDLTGKTIGCTALKDLSCTAMAAWIDENQGDSKAVKTLELPNPRSLGCAR